MSKSKKIISACVAGAAAVGLGAFAVIVHKDDKEVPTFSTIEVQPTTAPEVDPLPENWAELYSYSPSPMGLSARAQSLLRINKDVIGWITIGGTDVYYPFVLDPGLISADNAFYGNQEYLHNEYYLDHDMVGGYARGGTLFADCMDVFGDNEEEQSENIVIYGHNMANNTMFGSIRKYREDSSFYETAPFIELSSNYKDYDYVIFSYLITSGNYDDTDFRYWDMENMETQEDFDFYINSCRSRQMLDTGIDVQYGDKLLTLSTCYANEDNSRFIVVARRLRDGEVAGDLSTIQRTDEYIQAQQQAADEAASIAAEEEASSKAAAEANAQ